MIYHHTDQLAQLYPSQRHYPMSPSAHRSSREQVFKCHHTFSTIVKYHIHHPSRASHQVVEPRPAFPLDLTLRVSLFFLYLDQQSITGSGSRLTSEEDSAELHPHHLRLDRFLQREDRACHLFVVCNIMSVLHTGMELIHTCAWGP